MVHRLGKETPNIAVISKDGTQFNYNGNSLNSGIFFGNPETTTGGNALKFYASVRLDIRRIGSLKEKDQVVGNQVRVKVVKNKVAPPFKVVEFDIIYGEGISKIGELIDMGAKIGVLDKSGAWYSMGDQKLGQGKEATRQYLKEHPEIADKIEQLIRSKGDLVAEASTFDMSEA